jgi:hypothetical protein
MQTQLFRIGQESVKASLAAPKAILSPKPMIDGTLPRPRTEVNLQGAKDRPTSTACARIHSLMQPAPIDDLTISCPACSHAMPSAGVSLVEDGRVACSQCGNVFRPRAGNPPRLRHSDGSHIQDPEID